MIDAIDDSVEVSRPWTYDERIHAYSKMFGVVNDDVSRSGKGEHTYVILYGAIVLMQLDDPVYRGYYVCASPSASGFEIVGERYYGSNKDWKKLAFNMEKSSVAIMGEYIPGVFIPDEMFKNDQTFYYVFAFDNNIMTIIEMVDMVFSEIYASYLRGDK